MKYGNIELFVKVKGRYIDEYRKDGKTYVVGFKGSNYELEVKNKSSTRVKAVLSVDGLNILTGDTDWEKGYVVDAYASIIIPGFLIDGKKAASFEFNSIGKSYNQHNDSGDKANVGVIGCMVFDEEVKPYVVPNQYIYYPNPWLPYGYWNYPYTCNNLQNASSLGGAIGASQSLNLSQNSNDTFNASVKGIETPTVAFVACASPEPVEQSIGTKWGKEVEFKTREVSYDFKKAAACEIAIFYDSKKGLERRGIRLETKYTPKQEPNAFPGYRKGCPFPKD